MVKVFRRLKRVRRRPNSRGDNKMVSFSESLSIDVVSESQSVVSWEGESSSSCTSSSIGLQTPTNSTPKDSHIPGDEDKATTTLNHGRTTMCTTSGSSSSCEGDSMLAMIVYQRQPPPSLPDSWNTWAHSFEALLRSKEMRELLGSSRNLVTAAAMSGKDIVFNVGGVMVHVACLPVVLPLQAMSTATNLMVGALGNVVEITLKGAIANSSGESTSSEKPVEGLVQHVMNAVPIVFTTAGRITQGLIGSGVQFVAPVLGMSTESQEEGSPTGECTAEQDNFLDRLRLDIHLPDTHYSTPISVSRATPSDTSKCLLRVDDLNVTISPDPAISNPGPDLRALYVDLGKEFSDESITTDALSQLIQRGLDVVSTNPTVRYPVASSLIKSTSTFQVDWKPEGSTGKVVRKLSKMPEEEMYHKLSQSVLVWSGKYQGPKHYGSDCPFFLARGVVQRSPQDFMNMLWDSNRTSEYNKFSLGRTDVLVLDDSIREGGRSGAKVVKSETKVPFTRLTVGLCALMHVKTLDEGPKEGFIIVSRSLNSGMAGCHVSTSGRVEQNNRNEILLGVNVLRPVPGQPNMTDLISLSQCCSTIVPQFLAFRIGMMGVEDFFNNVREEPR